jgi:hypothetical protein
VEGMVRQHDGMICHIENVRTKWQDLKWLREVMKKCSEVLLFKIETMRRFTY